MPYGDKDDMKRGKKIKEQGRIEKGCVEREKAKG